MAGIPPKRNWCLYINTQRRDNVSRGMQTDELQNPFCCACSPAFLYCVYLPPALVTPISFVCFEHFSKSVLFIILVDAINMRKLLLLENRARVSVGHIVNNGKPEMPQVTTNLVSLTRDNSNLDQRRVVLFKVLDHLCLSITPPHQKQAAL